MVPFWKHEKFHFLKLVWKRAIEYYRCMLPALSLQSSTSKVLVRWRADDGNVSRTVILVECLQAMKPIRGFSSLPVRFAVLQKSGLQNVNLEMFFDCYCPWRGRVQILVLSACSWWGMCCMRRVQVWKMLRLEQKELGIDSFGEFWLWVCVRFE